MSYNGYSNYETWNVCLWLDNDPGTYHYWRDRIAEERAEHDVSGNSPHFH